MRFNWMGGDMERRTFIRRVALGVVGAAAGFLFPGIVGAASTNSAAPATALLSGHGSDQPVTTDQGSQRIVHTMPGADPGFAGGSVVSKAPDGVILQSAEGLRAVRISRDASVWKEFDVTPDSIDVGDWVDARGEPLSDGTLAAKSGWIFVNIGRRDGVVESLETGAVTVSTDKGVQQLQLSPRLEVINTSGTVQPGGASALRPGMAIGAVGLRLPDGGFRATRIWSAAL